MELTTLQGFEFFRAEAVGENGVCRSCGEVDSLEKPYRIKNIHRENCPLGKALDALYPATRFRFELGRFAGLMEEQLRLHEDKGSWEGQDSQFLIAKAMDNLREGEWRLGLLKENSSPVTPPGKSFVDAANFCMMIADNLLEKRVEWVYIVNHSLEEEK